MAGVSWISTPILSLNKKLSSVGLNDALSSAPAPVTGDEKLTLKYTWVFWEQNRQADAEVASTTYGDLTRSVATMSTVQEFWSTFNTLPQPSELLSIRDPSSEEPANPVGSFMFFKQGVRPEWEDPLNKSGGHFQFTLQTDKFRSVAKENASIKETDVLAILDEYWNNIVLSLIGNTFPGSVDITGLRLVDKSRHGKSSKPQGHVRVEIWFSQTTKIDKLRETIERILKTRPQGDTAAEFIPGFRLDTRFHDDTSMQQCTAELLAKKKAAPVA